MPSEVWVLWAFGWVQFALIYAMSRHAVRAVRVKDIRQRDRDFRSPTPSTPMELFAMEDHALEGECVR